MGKPRKDKSTLYLDSNLRIVFLVTLMAVLGVASITPAFPKIARELNISVQSIGLLITVFTLPGIFLTPLMGVLADRFGRKRIIVPSLILFGIAGGSCVFIRDFTLLLVFRFIQGVGAASLGSLNVTLIGDLFSGKERSAAMGYNASVLSVATAFYPAIGGSLATLAWYYPFALPFLSLPIGMIVLFSLKNPEPLHKKGFKEYLSSAFESMKKRKVITYYLASMFSFIILYGPYLTYFPLLMGSTFSAPPYIIGIIMSCMSIVTAVTASQLGKLVKLLPENTLLKISFALYALALLIIPFVSTLWQLLIPTVIFGIAHGINIPTVQTLLAGFAPPEQRAAFMSINGMVLRIGQTVGPIMMGAVFLIWGISGTFIAGSIIAVFMVLLMLILI